MTDEEKAEEYVNTHCCYYRQDFIRTYLDGLAEGRKELEKENAELKAKIASYEVGIDIEHDLNKDAAGEIELYQREVAELRNKIIERNGSIFFLKKQIEKMKICENCKKVDNCKVFANVDIKVCDKWELSE